MSVDSGRYRPAVGVNARPKGLSESYFSTQCAGRWDERLTFKINNLRQIEGDSSQPIRLFESGVMDRVTDGGPAAAGPSGFAPRPV